MPSESTARQGLSGWLWTARALVALWAAVEGLQLVTLVRWERTLVYARDFLPAAIAMQSLHLVACLAILLLLFRSEPRWALALGLAWGAMAVGFWVWPHLLNLLHWLAWKVGLTPALVHETRLGTALSLVRLRAVLGGLLAAVAVRTLALLPRTPLDAGILAASVFYAALYLVATGIIGRLLLRH
jgi:hypothetical protein